MVAAVRNEKGRLARRLGHGEGEEKILIWKRCNPLISPDSDE